MRSTLLCVSRPSLLSERLPIPSPLVKPHDNCRCLHKSQLCEGVRRERRTVVVLTLAGEGVPRRLQANRGTREQDLGTSDQGECGQTMHGVILFMAGKCDSKFGREASADGVMISRLCALRGARTRSIAEVSETRNARQPASWPIITASVCLLRR